MIVIFLAAALLWLLAARDASHGAFVGGIFVLAVAVGILWRSAW